MEKSSVLVILPPIPLSILTPKSHTSLTLPVPLFAFNPLCHYVPKTCTSLRSTKSQPGDRGQTQSATTAEELINGHWQMLGKGESVFFKNVAPDKLTMLPWKATHPGVYGEHQLYLVDFFVFRKKWSWVGRAGVFIWEELSEGLNMIKVHWNPYRVLQEQLARQGMFSGGIVAGRSWGYLLFDWIESPVDKIKTHIWHNYLSKNLWLER